MTGFVGFSKGAIGFYERLEADNTKTFWHANKGSYQELIKGPFEALAAQLASKYGPFHLFRPYNDVRFSKTKVPYKVHQGMVSESQGGAIFYVHLSAEGLMVASGYYSMATDQLERFRAAVDDNRVGPAIAKTSDALADRGYTLGAISELKTAPRGYAKDHPRIELLRRKGLVASKSFAPAPWMFSVDAAARIVEVWKGCGAMNRWLDRHVGPSTLAPEEDGWRR